MQRWTVQCHPGQQVFTIYFIIQDGTSWSPATQYVDMTPVWQVIQIRVHTEHGLVPSGTGSVLFGTPGTGSAAAVSFLKIFLSLFQNHTSVPTLGTPSWTNTIPVQALWYNTSTEIVNLATNNAHFYALCGIINRLEPHIESAAIAIVR